MKKYGSFIKLINNFFGIAHNFSTGWYLNFPLQIFSFNENKQIRSPYIFICNRSAKNTLPIIQSSWCVRKKKFASRCERTDFYSHFVPRWYGGSFSRSTSETSDIGAFVGCLGTNERMVCCCCRRFSFVSRSRAWAHSRNTCLACGLQCALRNSQCEKFGRTTIEDLFNLS